MKQPQTKKQPRLSTRKAQGFIALGAILFTILVCMFLYRYNNQHTAPGKQPVKGYLELSEQDFNDVPLHHLIQDWECYPHVLLTPQELQAHPEKYQPTYVSINDSDALLPSWGTYRLTLKLPEETMGYSIYMPAIYGAYQLYINDELYLQVGNPQPEDYREVLQEQVVNFRKRGEVHLMIAYCSRTGIYRGMIAPPVFGHPVSIHSLAERHRAFFIIFLAMTVMLLALSLSLYFSSHQKSKLCMVLICLSAIGYCSYPLLRILVPLPYHPWRSLSTLCYFSCHAAAVFAFSIRYRWHDRISLLLKIVSLACLGSAALIFALMLIVPSDTSRIVFAPIGQFLLLLTCLNGILLTIKTICSYSSGGPLLTIASVMLWSFNLIDLLTSNFDPIVAGRFPEIGMMFLLLTAILIEFLDVSSAYYFRLTYYDRIHQSEHLRRLEEAHYVQLQQQIDQARRAQHDLRQHLRVLHSMLEQGQVKELTEYLNRYEQSETPLLTCPLQFCTVPVVDALLSYYWKAAKQAGVEMEFSGGLNNLPESMCVDLCTALGNLLENALESVQHQQEGERIFRVQCQILQNQVVLRVTNSSYQYLHRKGDLFYSTKRDEPGIGTLSIRMIADQYHGVTDFQQENGLFTALVILQLPQTAPELTPTVG